MAILLLLLSVFALWGIGSGSSGVSHAPVRHFEPQVVEQHPKHAATRCKKVRIKGAAGQAKRCIYVPVSR